MSDLSPSPANPNVLLGNFAGIWRSDSAGARWVRPTVDAPGEAFFSSKALARVPGTATVYAAINLPTGTQLFRTDDDGARWTPLASLPRSFLAHLTRGSASGALYLSYLDPANGQNPIYRSTDGGATLTRGAFDLRFSDGLTAAVDDAGTDVICAGGDVAGIGRTVYVSRDGGDTFTAVLPGGTLGGRVRGAARDPSAPGRVALVTDTATVLLGDFRGTTATVQPLGVWTQTTVTGADGLASVAFDPNTPGTLLVSGTNPDGVLVVFRSTDGGATFTLLTVPGSGFPLALAFAAGSSSHVFLATSHAVYSSADGGSTWSVTVEGLRNGFVDTLAASPTAPGTLFHGGFGGGRSTDGGATFTPLSVQGITQHVLIDRSNDTRVLMSIDGVGSSGGLYRSTDSGVSWSAHNPSAPVPGTYTQNWGLAQDPLSPDTVYASWRTTGTIYKSPDFGLTWTDLGTHPGGGFEALAVNPAGYPFGSPQPTGGSQVLFAWESGSAGSPFRSTDAGATWTSLDPKLTAAHGGTPVSAARDLAFSDSNPNVLYYATRNEILRSSDLGDTWTVRVQRTDGSIQSVAVDPDNADHIFVVGGVGRLEESTDGGTTRTPRETGLVGDTMTLAFGAPGAGGVRPLYVGTAAGVFKEVPSASVNTGSGTGVAVTNGTPTAQAGAGSVTFTSVQSGGDTTITPVPTSDPAYVAIAQAANRGGVTKIQAAVDVVTNAIYAGGFTLCVTVDKPANSCTQIQRFQLYHVVTLPDGTQTSVALTDQTVTTYDASGAVVSCTGRARDVATVRYCGFSVSASPFFVGTANQTPIANAGPAQTVTCTSGAGAMVTLDGSASTDPDGDSLDYTWTGPFGTATGSSPTVSLPLGDHVVTLTVDDGVDVASATVTVGVYVGVQGFLAPIAESLLVPAADLPPTPTKRLKRHRVLPLKLDLVCAGGASLTDADVAAPVLLAVTPVGADGGVQDADVDAGEPADSALSFHWIGSHWQYNLETESLSDGTWDVEVQLADGTTWHAFINLRD